MNITIKKQVFMLHPFGSLYWKDKNILLISDLHLGKISHFRKNGLAIPNSAIPKNFEKLNELLDVYQPQKIIFLGDLFHSTLNSEWHYFDNWIQSISQKIILIEGNHDIVAKHHYENLHVEVLESLQIDDFLLTHHPVATETSFNFCGHIHPRVVLTGLGKQYLKIPCYFRKPNQLILPAFGEFTGNYTLKPTPNDKVYVLTPKEVIEVNLV
ncbi:ligase-associated DNA damage response endonuclease PdeM [Flavobacterium sp. TP390]|uniref:Ligase-associated DNA damage response endonuclease PdeM n=1 Tax=Flavobacterium profundi TaxID=1774945 RepID=A0A6I4IFU7_9FLAO|nr:ligase-associated DNA damage response endonuclease PdeM [Flavobacterium profundi]MVO08484.1 ligase-associated DNA damage response endonuclease PdeM [Flavobacterium profundi]